MHAKSLQSCPALCDPVDCSPPESMGLSRPEHWSGFPCLSPPNLGILHDNKKSHIQKKLASFFSLFYSSSRCLCCEYRSPQDRGAQPRSFAPLLGHLARLEASSVVITGSREERPWHPVGRGQGCC